MARNVSYTQDLKQEYEALFAEATVRPQHVAEVDRAVDRIMGVMDRYREVEQATGVPAHVIGIIHQMESSGNFRTHLHNGDPLTARTRHVPAGRPVAGTPPFGWNESAKDALLLKQLDRWDDWSVAGIAYVLERYNGFGYRLYHPHVKSPYLWSYTTAYDRGRYVADGKWSETAESKQPGGMAILKRMIERGIVPDARSTSPIPEIEKAVAALESAAVVAQVALQKHGFYRGAIDADWGPQSRTALLAYLTLHPRR